MSYKVLIVEDDPMVAMINEQYVCKNRDFEVVKCLRNGQEALEFLQENDVDLIVLDVYMPGMNGIETLKKIRERKISTEVIMVTAANDAATLEETMHLGVIDYLIKPFAFERFQVALEKFSATYSTLKHNEVFDQSSIDCMLDKSRSTPDRKLPKGIQAITLNAVIEYFDQNEGWQTLEMIAEKLNLSIVTVRHYLNYLVEKKEIRQDINYETGGRPSMIYKK